MAAAPKVTPREFLEALWSGCPAGWAEIQTIRPSATAGKKDEAHPWFFEWPTDFDRLLDRAEKSRGQWNVYHGVGVFSRPRGQNDDVLAVCALWADMDFKDIPRDQAIRRVKEFPLKPSAGVLSGGGLHAYWFLKEPLTGGDLERVRPICLGIARALGGDQQACTKKQLLRTPGSVNIKYQPHRPVAVAAWYPDLRYTADDFDMFEPPPEAKERPAGAAAPSGPRPAPATELPQTVVDKIVPLLSDIWIKGYRNALSLYFAGFMAHAEYSEGSALKVVRLTCLNSEDEESGNRERNVSDTYKKFVAREEVAGGRKIEDLIQEQFPKQIRTKALRVFQLISRSLPKSRKGGGPKVEPDFDLVKIERFGSEPSRYVVHVRAHAGGEVHKVVGDGNKCYAFKAFRERMFDTTKVFLANISQNTWEEMFAAAPTVHLEAPPESTLRGAITDALDDFLMNKKEKPEVGDLRSFAGFDDEAVFFSFPAFKDYLINKRKLKPTDQEILEQFKHLGWMRETKRLGPSTAKVWIRPSKPNGHGGLSVFDNLPAPSGAGSR